MPVVDTTQWNKRQQDPPEFCVPRIIHSEVHQEIKDWGIRERRNLEIPLLNSKMTNYPHWNSCGSKGSLMPLKQRYEHWGNGILLLKIILIADTYNKQLVLMNFRQLSQDWKTRLFSLQVIPRFLIDFEST